MSAREAFWSGRSVFVTGHTGFKGGWLTLWLRRLGSTVHGYALDPPTAPSFFELAGVERALASDFRADVRDLPLLRQAIASARPATVFHLAAQPLVRESYRDPVATFGVNTLGTVHVLEAIRHEESVREVVVVTTDKVYENTETPAAHRESDRLGGRDPYSASKAAAELATASFRSSYFGRSGRHRARIATARAGNVVGGGDWGLERLVPDCMRAFAAGRSVQLRHPDAVRPWQHVLEPLAGYLALAESLAGTGGEALARAWNFGPDPSADATVRRVAADLGRLWGPGGAIEYGEADAASPETAHLSLDSTDARRALGWSPRWTLPETLARTVAWYRAWHNGDEMNAFSAGQIRDYESGGHE
ncbi:MAG: CDP-glucose 4,6-dehydratase [Thermoanaerobaculia bacterium]